MRHCLRHVRLDGLHGNIVPMGDVANVPMIDGDKQEHISCFPGKLGQRVLAPLRHIPFQIAFRSHAL
jgi:hypothetical protein